jgi:hypothetical protein
MYSKELKVGDTVKIVNPYSSDYGIIGIITHIGKPKMDDGYPYIYRVRPLNCEWSAEPSYAYEDLELYFNGIRRAKKAIIHGK